MRFERFENRSNEEDWVMDFKKKYKEEMDGIQCTRGQKEAALSQIYLTKQDRAFRKKHAWQAAMAAFAVVCITAGAINRNQVVSFARSLLASFRLVTEDEVIGLDRIEPISFQKETFCQDPKTERIEDMDDDDILRTLYWRNFNSYQELHQLTGMELPRADLIKYGFSSVAVDFEQGSGHLSVDMEYQGMKFGANGMFAVDQFHQDGWGYGIADKIYETYEYAEGKYAYFVDYSPEAGNMDEVYFTQGDIMFQMFFPKSETARKQAKQLLDVFGQ